jgi:HD superfamily phosphodiesterase
MSILIKDARNLAEQLVAPLGRRWAHVQAVAAKAEELRPVVGDAEADILVAAAWLHDIGYAPEIGHTQFHPLDGGRHLRDLSYPERIVCLVAHHSGARYEAAERGLERELSVFELEDSSMMDALVTADLTTGPDGTSLIYDQRMDEILRRYEVDHPVHKTWLKARHLLAPCIQRTYDRMNLHQPK